VRVLYHVPLLRNIGDEKRDPGGISCFIENFVHEMSLRPSIAFKFGFPNSYSQETEAKRYSGSKGSIYHDRMLSAWSDRFVPLMLSDESGSHPRAKTVDSTSDLRRAFGQPREPFDVFHSFHNTLASRDRVRCRVRIATVYDLTPLLFPEHSYSETAHLEWFAMLHSIDPRRDWVICMSEATKRDLCAYTSMPPDRVAVIPGAASPRIFYRESNARRIQARLKRYGLSRHGYILSVSVIEPRKNLPHLIRSFFRFVTGHRIKNLKLVLAGPNGWSYDEVFKTVDRYSELRNRIIFPGYVPASDLNAIYNGALFLVYPSFYEGFGLPILEAMQCGVPVITSTTGSLPEVAGNAGILVDPRSEDQLCTAMHSLWSDPGLRGELARKGLARSTLFSWKQNVDQTINLYETALRLAK
jgi:glycosyltransferase involved in cell wall biosynthesis